VSDPEVLTLDLPHLRVSALAWGPPDGRLALCLHGFPDTAWTWRHVGPILAAHGYRVVAPFSRGYAPTAIPDDGDYHIVLANNGTAWLLIDGRETTAQAAIAPGEHRIELRQRDVPAQARLKIFWTHDGGTTVLVPPAAFSPQSPSDTQAQH